MRVCLPERAGAARGGGLGVVLFGVLSAAAVVGCVSGCAADGGPEGAAAGEARDLVLAEGAGGPGALSPAEAARVEALFAPENLVAWCIVPFDTRQRGPAERAAMLESLGFGGFAYDWQAAHLPGFEEEVGLLREAGVRLDGVWLHYYRGLAEDVRHVLDVLERTGTKTDLWVLIPDPEGADDAARVEAAAAALAPLADEAARIGCRVGLYNHGGWFGEPENQIAVIERLARDNVGIVYNFHHGHGHLDQIDELLEAMLPYLYCVNLNGMVRRADPGAEKILPLGCGEADLDVLRSIVASGYEGRVGVLGHTEDDAELRLRDNLEGLAWLVGLLRGDPPVAQPATRTY